jgi:dienelactone hydrolase
MRPLARSTVLLALLVAALTASASLWAQQNESLPKGQVVAKVPCRSDPTQSYALYLPSHYGSQKAYPILYAFDPGARGSVPVENFQAAAEKYGYIVVGSNDSRNGPWEITLRAAQAMWEDTHQRFTLDERRAYMTGFSGGARVACGLARMLRGRVAGVIACGAGFPIGPGAGPAKDTPFVFFGTIGIRDFNFTELKELDKTLDDLGLAHRIEVFAGDHDWPPPDLSTQAIEWMGIQAMKSGKRERDQALLDELYGKRVDETRRWAESGDLARAARRYRALADDFDGLRDVSEVRTKLDQLQGSKELKEALKREAKRENRIAALEAEYLSAYYELTNAFRTADGSPAEIHQMVQQLQLPGRREQAAAKKETEESIAAERFVRGVLVQTYEQARDALAAKDFRRAKLNLQIAAECAPDSAYIHYTLARAYALNRENKNALAALRQAVEKGYADLDAMEKNQEFDGLRQMPGYRDLVRQLTKK